MKSANVELPPQDMLLNCRPSASDRSRFVVNTDTSDVCEGEGQQVNDPRLCVAAAAAIGKPLAMAGWFILPNYAPQGCFLYAGSYYSKNLVHHVFPGVYYNPSPMTSAAPPAGKDAHHKVRACVCVSGLQPMLACIRSLA